MKTITRKKEISTKKSPEIARLIRLIDEMGIDYSDVARDTEVAERTITNFIWSDKPIGGQLLRALHAKYGASIDWLLSGNGPMFINKTHEPQTSYQSADARAQRMNSFINKFIESATEDEQAWLEMQLKFSVPQYQEFIEGNTDEH